jgi:signal transduction histidine kinase
VLAHRSTLIQILVNLVSNAIKFSPSGSEPRVRIRAEGEEAWVRLWVEDAGIGVAPEHQERIFGVFERLHGVESYPGTGMGLAIVKKCVQRMGGDVGLESGLGKGSRFWVRLRRAPDAEPTSATPS